MVTLCWVLFAMVIVLIVGLLIVCNRNDQLRADIEFYKRYSNNIANVYLEFTHNLVDLRDKKPKGTKANAAAMQLSNEISKYIREDGDEIVITVFDTSKQK